MSTLILSFYIRRPWLSKEDGRYVEECKKKDTFKYKWRRCWEVYHRVSGVIAIGLGFTQVCIMKRTLTSTSCVFGKMSITNGG